MTVGISRLLKSTQFWKLQNRRTWGNRLSRTKKSNMYVHSKGNYDSSQGRTPKVFRTRRAGASEGRGAEGQKIGGLVDSMSKVQGEP